MGEKKQIRIAVKDKIACLVDKEQFLVCGNNDYEVVFDFDSDWEGISAKTAVFVYGNTPIHQPFVDNVCEGVEIKNATLCAIGVFAGNIKTTTGATIECRQSIRDIGGVPKPPSKEVYDEIMALLDKAIEAHTELPVGGKKGQVLKKVSDKDYDTEWANDEQRDLSEIEEKIESLNNSVSENAKNISVKLDKTDQANKIYGTNANGKQTYLPFSSLATQAYSIVSRGEDKEVLVPQIPLADDWATPRGYVNGLVKPLEERVSDLEYLTLDYPSDTTTAYEKTVPADVGSKALIKSIGGASLFSNNLLDPADFTSDNVEITVNNDGSITFELTPNSYAQIRLPSLPEGTYYFVQETEVTGGALSDSSLVANSRIYSGMFEIMSSDLMLFYEAENMDFSGTGEGEVGTKDVTVTAKLMISKEELPFEPYFPPKNAEVERVESIGANIIPFPYNYKGKVMDVGYKETINGVTFEVLENGLVSAIGTATAVVKFFIFEEANMPAGLYYLSGVSSTAFIVSYNGGVNGSGVVNTKIEHKAGAFSVRVQVTSGTTVNAVYAPIVTKDVYVKDFVPYSAEPIDTLEIPEAVRNLDGYGREGSYIEWKDGKATFTVTKDENLEILTEPEVKDITSYFDKNKLSIQRAGLLRFVNKDKLPVPSHIVYVKRKG